MTIAAVDYEYDMNPGPTVENFRIDATSGPDSKWNACSGQLFADDFCATEYPEAVGKGFADILSEFRLLLPEISTVVLIRNLKTPRAFPYFSNLFSQGLSYALGD